MSPGGVLKSQAPMPRTPKKPAARRPATAKKPEATRRPEKGSASLLWLGAILVTTLVAYVPSLGNGFINWDDDVYVTKNALVRHPENLQQMIETPVGGNHHPLTMYSLALNYRISGDAPRSYHALSLILHLINTALVFLFVRALAPGGLWAPVVTALFFGIHPTHVESVAWVAERKDVLYAVFYLAALIAYVKYLGRGRVAWLGVCLASFVLSLASKPAAVVLPVTLLAIDFYRKRPFTPRVMMEKLPFVALSVIAGILTLGSQETAGAVGSQDTYNIFQRATLASYGFVMYFVHLLAPFHLSALYPYPDQGRGTIPLICYIDMALVVLGGILAWRARSNHLLLFGLLFFVVNIALVLQLFPVGEAIMADRYTYVPYIGLFFVIGGWLDLSRRAPSGNPGRQPKGPGAPQGLASAAVWGVAALALVCVVQTYRRCQVWKDSGIFWTDVIQKYPRASVNAYNNRGQYYRQTKQLDRAMADFTVALSLRRDAPLPWANRGNIYFDRDQNDSAIVSYDRALALKPDMWETLANRGSAKAKKGDYAGSIADLTRALEHDPGNGAAWENRALTYIALNDFARALPDYRKASELNPRDDGLVNALAVTLQNLGRTRESIDEFGRAIAMAPSNGLYYMNRSRSWYALGDRAKAMDDVRKASGLGVDVPQAYRDVLGGL